MDWFASGIRNEFRYEMLDPWCRSSLGDLPVYSCLISEGYHTDAKARAEIECDGSAYVENSAVRVWHTATLGAESATECLGTFVADTQSETLRHGASALALSMMHPLDKMATDCRCGDWGVSAGADIASFVRGRVEGSGCTADIAQALEGSGKGFPSAWVWEHGESTLAAIQSAADACGYQVGADAMGNVTFYPYVAPANRDAAFEFPDGALSVTMPEVKVSTGDVVNCVNVKATKDQDTITSRATVAADHPWHFTRIGRWYAKNYEESQMETFTQEAVDAKARRYLASNDGTSRKWEAECLYAPVRCGDVVLFSTGDGAARCKAMVQQRKIECDPLMRMELVLDEVM